MESRAAEPFLLGKGKWQQKTDLQVVTDSVSLRNTP